MSNPSATTNPANSRASQGLLAASRKFFQKHGVAVALVLPFLILFLTFIILPVIRSLYFSFTDYNGIRVPNWIGLENYFSLFKEPRFYKALSNTAIYMGFVSIIGTSMGLLLALVFGSQSALDQFFRAAFFLPSVAGGVGLISVFKWIFSSEDYGLVNTIRQWLGLETVRFLGDPNYAIPVLITMAIWGVMGYNMIIFVAGLRSISNELYEAAAIDGANPSQRFFKITLPLLRPTILYVLVTGMIGSFQVFYEPYVLFAQTSGVGGILDSSLTLVVFLYERGFHRFEMGLASAIAWVLFLMLFVLTAINLRLGRANDID